MQASEGEAETDSMFANRPTTRSSFTPSRGGGTGGSGRSRGTILLVVALIIGGIFGGWCEDRRKCRVNNSNM